MMLKNEKQNPDNILCVPLLAIFEVLFSEN